MRKLCSFMASLALCFSLFSASAFAAESTGNIETAVPTNPTLTSLSNLTDNSQRVVTDGLYVDIYYPTDTNTYIPEFTLELWDVQTDKLISTAIGNSQNYQDGKYRLIFNHPGYRLGDELALILRKTDGIIEEINFNGYHLKLNTHVKFTIDSFDYYEGDNDERAFRDMTATKLHPLTASLVTNPKIGLSLQSESGVPLKKTPVEIKLLEGKGSFQATSDDHGMIWLNTDKLTWRFLVSSKGLTALDGSNGKAEIELPAPVVAGTQKSAVILPIIFKSATSESDSKIAVSLSTDANTDLSKAWSEFDLTLTDANGVRFSKHTAYRRPNHLFSHLVCHGSNGSVFNDDGVFEDP